MSSSGGINGMRSGRIALALSAIAVCSSAYAQYTGPRVAKLASEVVYRGLPGDLQTTILYGDPTKPGPFVTRLKIPPGVKVLPHWNPDEAHTVTVLSGTLYYAVGEQWDEAKLAAYPAGSFLAESPKTAHYEWAKAGEVILQITGIGPTGAMPIQSVAK
jgi:quercetin dioxygenase-like cupin family protein